MTTGRPETPVTTPAAGRPRMIRRAWDAVRYGVRLTLLTFFGPARLDDLHDPIARLKRERARQCAGYAVPSGVASAGTVPAAAISTLDDAEHAERIRFEQAVAHADTARRRLLWDDAVRRWGPADASRIWQEALSAEDASQT